MASYIPPPLEIKSTMYKSCSLANRKPIDGFIGPCVNRQKVSNTLLLTKCSERRSLWKGRKPIEAFSRGLDGDGPRGLILFGHLTKIHCGDGLLERSLKAQRDRRGIA